MQIVVVGAGYAGALAANTLVRRLPAATVSVVNPRPEFVERVRLHEQAAGTGAAAVPLGNVLLPGVRTVLGEVVRIEDGAVALADGARLAYDALVVAVGSGEDPLPGTVPVGSWDGARAAGRALAQLAARQWVTVVGAGLTGVEAAAEIAEARPDLHVRLVGDRWGVGLSEGGWRRARRGLEDLGVVLVDGRVERAVATEVVLSDGTVLASDLAVWAVLGGAPAVIRRSGLAVDEEGRAVVDRYLRSVDDERVHVVGDCAAVPGARPSCATAMPQAAYAARSLARVAQGRRIRPYSMGYVGQAISLGRRDAVIQVVRRDDSPREAYLAGRAAALVKEGVCRFAALGARSGRYAWLGGPR